MIDKLKSAELAIKTLMKESAELKVQTSADKEVKSYTNIKFSNLRTVKVISYLDLHRLEIDSINRDLLSKNEALRATADVLSSVNSQMVMNFKIIFFP